MTIKLKINKNKNKIKKFKNILWRFLKKWGERKWLGCLWKRYDFKNLKRIWFEKIWPSQPKGFKNYVKLKEKIFYFWILWGKRKTHKRHKT